MTVTVVTSTSLATALQAPDFEVRAIDGPLLGDAHRPAFGDEGVLVLDAAAVGASLPLRLLFALPLAGEPSVASADGCVPRDADPATLRAAVARVAERSARARRLRTVVASTSDATYEARLPDGPVTWEGDLERLIGVPAGQFAPDMGSWLARILPEDHARLVEAVEQSLRVDRPYDVSYRVRHRDGSWRAWRDRGSVSVASDGTVRYVGAITDVTAESSAHARYAALNDRLRIAAASLGFGIYEVDFRSGRAWFSPEARAMFGAAAGEEIAVDARGIPSAVVPEDVGTAQRAAAAALAPEGHGEMSCEFRVRRPEGDVRWLQARAQLFFEQDGEGRAPTWATGVLFDVTERREAEIRLRGRDSRLRQIMRTSPIGIVFARLSGEMLDCNDAFLRILGWAPGEVDATALDWRSLAVASDGGHDVLAEMASTGAIAPIETQLRRRDGSLATVLATGVRFDPGLDEQVAFVFDLTPMKQAEHRLRASEQQFRLVLERAPIPIFLHTLEGEIEARSGAVEALTGWTPDETPTGADWFRKARRLEGEALAAEAARVQVRLAAGEMPREEVDIWTKDGRRLRWLYHGSSVIDSGDGRRFVTSMAIDVTAHRDAAERLADVAADLRQTNALLDAIFTSAPVGISFWDRDLRFRRVNARLAEINGMPVEAHLGHTPAELLPDIADLDSLMAKWREVIEQRRTHVIEVRGSTPAAPGVERFWREHFFPVEIDGRVVGGSAVIEEVSSQRLAEERLRDSERRFRLFAENVDDVLWMMRPEDGRTLYVSPAYERVWGRGTAALYADPHDWIAGIHPDDRARVADEFARQARTGGYDQEFRVERPDGGIRWVRDRGFPVKDEAGQLICIAGIAEDITDRRQTAERLEEEEQRYRRIFEQTTTSTWELDLSTTRERLVALRRVAHDGIAAHVREHPALTRELLGTVRVRSVNPATLQLLGVASPEALRSRLRTFLTDDTVEFLAATMEALAEGRPVLHQETTLRTADDRRVHVLVRARLPGVDEPADQVLVSLLDVTAMKDAEAVLREANQRKDEFLAMLAHELRNPLAPIRNAAEALRLARSEEPVVRWARDLIERQVSHLAHIVDDLLDVSRIVQGKVVLHRVPLDVRAVVRSAVETNRSAIDARGHALVLELPADPLPVEGDFVRLAQVVGNLLTNAAKYTREGGRITVSAAPDGAQVTLRVKDTGEGIARELLPQVFDLFTQAHRTIDRSQGGLGIGLTVVKRLVEMHGGEVSAASDGPGRGAEFVIRLPRIAAMPDALEHRPLPAPCARASGPVRVLVVDDNTDAAESLAELLRLSGYAVKTAPEGSTALGVLESFRPEVALLDLGLPGMDGFELARRLRQHPCTANAMLVAVTGYGREEDVRQAHAAGFDHHLVKPVDLAALRELLTTVG